MILFLDLDGVLHPDPARPDQLFQHAPRLGAMLAEFPKVSVVLSTSWRLEHPLHVLIEPLDRRLGARVIGTTPRLADCKPPPALVPYRRHAECVQWLHDHGLTHSGWVALDDRTSWFAPYCEQLIACDGARGLDDEAAGRLRFALLRGRAEKWGLTPFF